jgi:hypothetical protein
MTPQELVANIPSKAKWIIGFVVLLFGTIVAVLIGAWPPAWILVLLGSMALLYIVARLRSRYDPLDPRFGSCIPPINVPRATNGNSPSHARPNVQSLDG